MNKYSTNLLLLLSSCALAGSISCQRHNGQAQRLPKTEIRVGGTTLAVEVAMTPEQRRIGMMHRRHLAPDEGMLFVFPYAEILAFYMRNTHVPLSIAFIRSDGTITNISHMEPLSLATHESRLPCRYALEMPRGWFKKNNVREGSRVEIPAAVRAEE